MWSDCEETYLKENVASKTAKELSDGLSKIGQGKTPDAVRMQCRKMGYSYLRSGGHQWTEEEEKYLRKHYGEKISRMAKALGLGMGAVRHKIYRMGLNNGEMKRVTPWVNRLLDKVDEVGKTLYDKSVELWQQGRTVSIESNDKGNMALFCRERRE